MGPSEAESAAQRPAKGRWALPGALLALGLIATVLLILSDWIRERLILEDVARMHALGEIQSRVATAHLWIEEHVTDDDVALDEVYQHLDRSRMLALAMLGRSDEGAASADFEIEPLSDAATLRSAAELLQAIEEFTQLSRSREKGHAAGEPVGIGSAHDIHYDHVFQEVLASATSIDRIIARRMRANHRRSKGLFAAIVAAWGLIVAMAVTGLGARERRRAKAEAALRAREEELLQARKMEAVGRLAGGIAHDINNYLAAITAQCERAKMKAEPESRLALRMTRVIATAMKASALIKQLLAFTRRQPLRLRTIDLNRSVEDLAGIMRQLMGKDLRIETELTQGLWPVEMDPSQVEQVMVNLLVNAQEAMPGGGTVRVSTANLPAGDSGSADRVELAISDDGPGIAPEIRDKLFEPFFTTKGEHGGSGLGLATVYGIVTQAGGSVTVESVVGEGTRFAIRLPRSEGTKEIEQAPVAEAVGGGERILLVDDNRAFRISTRAMLETLGYLVVEAEHGQAALGAFEAAESEAAFDLLISDLRMPGLSGPELADRLRRRRPELKLLFISGSSGISILTQGFELGEFDILHKPFTLAELDRGIRLAMKADVDASRP